MARLRCCILLLLGTAAAFGSRLSFEERAGVQESLRYLPPNMRFYELDRPGMMPRSPAPSLSESTGLRMVGKWGAGPSVKVTGRDSLVFLSRGSQVAVINYADTTNPQVLSYIEVNGLVSRSVLVGNRLYVGSTGSDPKFIDVFDVTDPANPQRLGHLQTRLLDIDVVDTLVYTVAKDSFRVFDFADPANPKQIGACRDTGYTLSACNGYAYIADRWGLYVVDVRDPTNPHHEGSWGTDLLSVKARGTICCVTTSDIENNLAFHVLDIRQPSSIAQLGSIDSCGGYDSYIDGSLVFLSGFDTGGHVFRILDISDSTHPNSVGSCPTTHTHFGVWANLEASRAYVADDLEGLSVVDIANLADPRLDTVMLKAGFSYEVDVQGASAYVAQGGLGLKVLDVSDPRTPHEVGSVDSTRDVETRTVAVRDSFAFIGWVTHPLLRVVDVSDPRNPRKVAACDLFNAAEAMVWVDSFLYVAEYYRFQIVNVARPRQPVLVGTCTTRDLTWAGLCLRGDTAYVAGPYNGIHVIDVTDPPNPSPVKVLSGISTWGCYVRDSLLFVSDFDDSLHILNIANLYNVYQLGAVHVTGAGSDVKVLGDYAYVGAKGLGLVDISDPRNPILVADYATPDNVMRVVCDSPHVYAACYGGGVCIFETTQVAVGEPKQSGGEQTRDGASVVRGVLNLEVGSRQNTVYRAELLDVGGRKVLDLHTGANDVRALAPGVYFVREAQAQAVRKIVLTE